MKSNNLIVNISQHITKTLASVKVGMAFVFLFLSMPGFAQTPCQITVNVTSNPAVLCSGNTATITATGGTTYTWQPGNLTGATITVSPTVSTTYTVSGSNALGCTGTSLYTLPVAQLNNITITPNQLPCIDTLQANVPGASNTPPNGARFYLRDVEPWSVNDNINAMNAVFGANNYTVGNFAIAPATVFNANTQFVFLEGSDANAVALNTFFTANQTLIENWVYNGGRLFINAAPNQGGNMNWGFGGVMLNYNNAQSTVTAVNPTHPIFLGPSLPTATSFTGNSYSHAHITGGNTTPIITGSSLNILTQKYWGGGLVLFGGITQPNFHQPPTEAQNVWQNIFHYTANTSTSLNFNYVWSNSSTNSYTIPTTPGTYTVTVTGYGCSGTATYTANAVTPPVVASASPASICSSNSSTLSATGATTYTWQPGNLSGSSITVNPTTTTVYTLTGTNAANCSASDTAKVIVNPSPQVSIVQQGTSCTDSLKAIVSGLGTGAPTPGARYYIREGNPWNTANNTNAMTAVFGAANFITTTFTAAVPASIFTSTTQFVFLEGSDANALALNSFFTSNQTLIENWVNNGGRLFINAAPNQGANMSWGFGGVTLNYNSAQPTGTAVSPTHPIFVGPSLPTATILNGNSYSHAHITGGNTTAIMSGGGVNMLTEKTWGNGFVMFGGITSPNFHSPATEAQNVWQNIINYTANGAASAPSITYLWSNNATTSYIIPPGSGTYTVTVTANGCPTTATYSNAPVITATSNTSSICLGQSATLTAGGGNTYVWQPGNLSGNNITVNPTANTTYTVTGTTAQGCTNTATVTITVNTLLNVTASASPTSVCPGGSSVLSATGGISYTWLPGNLTGSPTVTPTLTTTYTVTATNANGCTKTATVTVSVNNVLNVVASASPTPICLGGSSVLSATGGTTYLWTPGNLTGTPTVSPTATTIYTVTATSANGCTGTSTVNVTVNLLPTVVASATPTTICLGASSVLSATGGTSYTWVPGNLTGSPTVSPTATTIYTVTATNANGCTITSTIGVTVNSVPNVVATASPTAICLGGSSVLSATGGTTYSWMPGNLTGSPTVSPTATTTYTVTATNANGCTKTTTLNVTVNSLPNVTAAATPSSICLGGTSVLSANGGTTYSWVPGNLTGSPTVSPTATTIYTVTATNANGCTKTTTLSVTVNNLPNVTASASPSSICVGGSSVLSATGGTTYSWLPGNLIGSPTVSPTATTTYTVTATNANGCTNTSAVTLSVNNVLNVVASASPTAICLGGSSVLSATGGTTYSWVPGNLTGSPTVSPTATTTYTVTATNANGCSNTSSVTVTVNNLPNVTASASPSTICLGASTVLSATGGTTYSWVPGNLTGSPTVSPTTTTTYTVTATNANGCTKTTTLTVTVNNLPNVTASASPSSICVGGSSVLSATGGTTYSWLPGNLTGSPTVSPTATTTYTVTATNANGCSNTSAVTISVNNILNVVASASPTAICLGGSSVLNATGGTNYSWVPGNLTGSPTVSPTATTTYTVTATNANGCSNTSSVTVSVNNLPNVTASATPSTICLGASTVLSATGGTSYSWVPGNLTGSPTVSPTATTTYTVTATNANGCTKTTTLSVTVNNLPNVTASASPSSICVGGSSVLSATGGTTYSWLPGNLTGSPTVSPTATTTYTVTATNANGCTNTSAVTLSVNSLPAVNPSASSNAICIGNTSVLSATGGASYLWIPGNLSGTPTVSPTATTTYTVTATNANGCSNTGTITITVNNVPNVNASASPNAICLGGASVLSATGGASYVWVPGNLPGTPTVSPTATTTYTVTATSANGCTNTNTVTLSIISSPPVTASASPAAICIGGSTVLSATGGNTYSWMPGNLSGTPSISPTATTTYTVSASNVNGCNNTATITVVVNQLPSIGTSPLAICLGNSTTLMATGASMYTWQPGNLSGMPTINPNSNITYTVTGTDMNGCSNTAFLTVTVYNSPVVGGTAVPSEICNGGGSVLQGNGAVSYQWLPLNIFGSPMVFPNVSTTYTVVGTNAYGCSATSVVQLNVVPQPVITQQPANQVSTNGSSAQFTVQCNNPNATYLWQRNYGIGYQNLSNTAQYSGTNTNTLTVNNLNQYFNGNTFRCQISLPGCMVISNPASLKVDFATGIDTYNEVPIDIYPNPATTELHIKTPDVYRGSSISLYDMSGRVCYTGILRNEESTIDISSLSRGVYTLRIFGPKGSATYRVLLRD